MNDLIVLERDRHETDVAAVGGVIPRVVLGARRHKGAAPLAPEQELARDGANRSHMQHIVLERYDV